MAKNRRADRAGDEADVKNDESLQGPGQRFGDYGKYNCAKTSGATIT